MYTFRFDFSFPELSRQKNRHILRLLFVFFARDFVRMRSITRLSVHNTRLDIHAWATLASCPCRHRLMPTIQNGQINSKANCVTILRFLSLSLVDTFFARIEFSVFVEFQHKNRFFRQYLLITCLPFN